MTSPTSASRLPSRSAGDVPGVPASPSALAARGSLLVLGVIVVLVSLNLRPLFSSLSVLLPEVVAARGLSPMMASLLTTVPVLCMGVFAFVAPALAQRLGSERTLLMALLLITVGTAMRSAAPVPVLFVGVALAGAGIAQCNVLLPALIKRDFGRHAAMMLGFFTMAVACGAAVAAAITVPLAHALAGSWAMALGAWALLGVAAVMAWAWRIRGVPRPEKRQAVRVQGLWRDALAWQVTAFMGLQSAFAYIVLGYLAPILRDRGLDGIVAGYVTSVSVIAQVLACLVTPALAVRCRHQRGLAVGVAVVITGALAACLYAPLSGAWVWAAVLGLAQGAGLALALTLIVLRSPDARVAASLSAMAQGVGYTVATVGPLSMGLLRGTEGQDASVLGLLLVLGTALAWSGWGAGRALYVRKGLGAI